MRKCMWYPQHRGFPGGAGGKLSSCQCRRCKRGRFNPWAGKAPWRRAWHPTPVCLPGESHGQRGLGDYSPESDTESDTTEQLSMHARILSTVLNSEILLSKFELNYDYNYYVIIVFSEKNFHSVVTVFISSIVFCVCVCAGNNHGTKFWQQFLNPFPGCL